MASKKEYLDFILDQLSELEEITYRSMMGEYIIYYRGKVVGGIYDDRFLVKPTKSAVAMMPDAGIELPYEGAKGMLLVDDVENREFMNELLEAIYAELPAPKKKLARFMECVIREWKIEDKTDLAGNLNNINILNNLRDGIPYPYTEKDAEEFIMSMLSADKSKTFAFAITVDGKVIGSIGIFRRENIHSRTAEMGYYIGEPYWGNGYTTGAVKQACEYVFENSDIIRIFAEPFSYNDRSCRVLEKSGFQYEGTLHSNAIKNGEILDMKMYALIKK